MNDEAPRLPGPLQRDLLTGYINGHAVFRLISVIYIAIMFFIGSSIDARPWGLLVSCGLIAVSTLVMYLGQCWRWSTTQQTITFAVDKWTFRWPRRRELKIVSYPLHPVVVDVWVLCFLVAKTGGLSSVFIPLYSMMAATGDIVYTNDGRKRGLFIAMLFASFFLASCAPLLHSRFIVEYEGLRLVASTGSTNLPVYLATLLAQALLMIILGHVIHKTAEKFVEAFLRPTTPSGRHEEDNTRQSQP
jgi:hypothetical protein